MNLFNSNFNVNPIFAPLKKPVQKKILLPSTNRISELGNIHIPKDELPKTPKKYPMSSDQIKAHSILENWPQMMPKIEKNCFNEEQEYGVLRHAANLIGGGFITGAKTKGKRLEELDSLASPKENFELWEYLLDDIAADIPKEISTGIKHLKTYSSELEELAKKPANDKALNQLALKYARQIQSLQIGKSLPLYGGWSNAVNGSGHGVVYEFTRIDETHFDISIITSTGFQLADATVIGNKTKIQPVVLFAKVPESLIFFSDDKNAISSTFIRSLIEPRVLARWQPDRKFSQEDILESFDHLLKYQVKVPAKAYGLITGQRGGTCVPSSTKQWIRKKTNNLGLYKQIIFRCKFKMLVGTYQKLKNELSKDSTMGQLARNLLKYSLHNLLRNVAKLIKEVHGCGTLIDPTLAEQVQATCYDLLEKIEFHEKRLENEKRQFVSGSDLSKVNSQKQRKARIEDQKLFEWTSSRTAQKSESLYIPQKQEIKNPKDFHEKTTNFLSNRVDISQKLSEMHQIIDSLPLPIPPSNKIKGLDWVKAIKDPFWSNCSIEELQLYLQDLEKLMNAYPVKEIGLPGRLQATCLTLHSLTHYLSLLIEKKMVEKGDRKNNTGLLVYYKARNHAKLTTCQAYEGTVYPERSEHEKIVQSFNYFQSFNAQAQYEALFTKGGETEICQWDVKEDKSAGIFWKGLIEGDSELRHHVEKAAHQKWRDLSENEIKNDFERRMLQYDKEYNTYKNQLEQYNKNEEKWLEWNRTERKGFEPKRTSKPNSPTKPTRKVNLPESTKITLLLEKSADKDNTNVLSEGKNNYNHINIFRRMNYNLSHALQGTLPENFNVKGDRSSDYSYKAVAIRPDFSSDKVLMHNFGSLALNKCLLPLNEEHTNAFHKEPKFQRKVYNWDAPHAEGHTLMGKKLAIPKADTEKLAEIVRALPEWKLAPFQIINALEGDLGILKDSSYQAVLLNLFFRSPVLLEEKEKQESNIRLGLGELIIKDQALQKRFKEFLNIGLAYFKRQIDTNNKEKNEEERKSFDGARFFFSLAFLLSKYAADAGKEKLAGDFNYIREINEWLEQAEKKEIFLTEEEKAALHLKRVLFYSTIPRESLKTEDFITIYQSFIAAQMYPCKGKWKNPIEERVAQDFILNLYSQNIFPKVSSNNTQEQKFTSQLCNGILSSLKLITHENEIKWNSTKDNILHGENNTKGYWEIDFVRGVVYSEKGKIGCGPSQYPWTQQADFNRLFGGNTRFAYRSLGDNNYTFDSKFGPIRLIKKSNWHYAIQRQYNGRWYQLMDARIKISNNSNFGILGQDHTFWIPMDKEKEAPGFIQSDKYKIVGYLSALENGERKYALTDEGRIIEVEPTEGLVTKDSHFIDLLDKEEEKREPILSGFDLPTSILLHRNKKNEQIEKISLPRYLSTEGSPLEFLRKHNRFIWTDNNRYALSEKKPKSLLGSLKEGIYLESTKAEEKNQGKLLIPFQPIIADAIPIPFTKIDIGNQKPLLPIQGSLKEQWGCNEYLVFDVNCGAVSASSPEEKLFLAYIYYSQKRFDDAVNLLRELRPTDPLFERGIKILDLIQSHPLGEDHPDAKMVALQALFMQMKRKQDASKVKVEQFISNPAHLWKILKLMKECPQRLNDISVDCKFSCEDELWLYQTLHEEAKRRKKEILDVLSLKDKLKLEKALWAIDRRKKILQNSKKIKKETPNVSMGQRNIDPSTEEKFDSLCKNNSIFSTLPKKQFLFRYYNENEQEYQLRVKQEEIDHERHLENEFEWLRTGPKISLFDSCPPKDFKNGHLFSEVLNIAQKGSKWEQREAMFCLKQWKIHDDNCRNIEYLDLMIQILYGLSVENLNDPKHASVKEIYAFFESTSYTFGGPKKLSDLHNFIGGKKEDFQNEFTGGGDYPIIHKSFFDMPPEPKKPSHPKKISVSLASDAERWKELLSWRKLYDNQKAEEEKQNYKDFSFEFDEETMLAKDEKDFKDPLVKALELFSEDYKEGKKQNEAEKTPRISKKIAQNIWDIQHTRYLEIEKDINRLTDELEQKARNKSSDDRIKQYQTALIGGKVKRDPTFADCVRCLQTQDIHDYKLMNENLGEKKMELIAQLTLKIEDLKSHQAQLARIGDWCKKIIEIDNELDFNRQYACIRLDQELQAKYHFDNFTPAEQIIFRVFAGQTGKIPYIKQVNLIQKMLEVQENDPTRFKGAVGKLIMGGGKTDVVAVLAIYLSILKNKDRLGIFIVPPSLFDTVKNNFDENMKKAFGISIETIDIEREHLKDDNKLLQILQKLEVAKRDTKPLVAKATSLQCFELELFSVSRNVRKTTERLNGKTNELQEAKQRAEHLRSKLRKLNQNQAEYHHKTAALNFEEKVVIPALEGSIKSLQNSLDNLTHTAKLLAQILEEFAQRGDPIGDEADKTLGCRQEVNFPEGDSTPIDPMVTGLICEVYKVLTDENIKVPGVEGTPTIGELTGLRKNRQGLLNTNLYKTKVVPVVARALAENYAPLQGILGDYKENFIRYTSGKMPSELQKLADDKQFICSEEALNNKFPKWQEYLSLAEAQQDIAFLRELALRHTSDNAETRLLSNSAALCKHVLTELTPATLGKSGRRDYGPKPDSNHLEIIPYVAVNAPAKTEFGYYLELACYYLQWILANPLEEKDLRHIGKMAKDAASYYVSKNGEKLSETVEYIAFKEMFGITFDELNDPEKVEKALESISKNPSMQLLFAYEMISQNVSQRNERYTSNWAALCDLFASFRVMGGTPWNYEGFKPEQAKRLIDDIGTEGKIIHAIAKKAEKMRIHEVEAEDLDQLFKSIYADSENPNKIRPDANKVRGIIEGGGYFKKFKSNRDVAEKIAIILEKMQKEKQINDSIEDVLYYDADPNQQMANTLYAFNIRTKSRVRIGGTSIEAFLAKQKYPQHYFTYYDEGHTVGADIQQLADAIFVATFGEDKTIDALEQELMRLRQFLLFQMGELAVSPSVRKLLINKGSSIQDFILSALKNQTIRKTKDMIRFFRQQIDNIFRFQASSAIRKAALSGKNLAEVSGQYESFVLTKTESDLFLLFGSLKPQVDTKEMLVSYLDKQFKRFKNKISDIKAIESVKKKKKELSNYIKKEVNCLPKNWEESSGPIGTENEVELQAHIENQTQINVDNEIETDVELELKGYEQLKEGKIRKDSGMSPEKLKLLIERLKNVIPVHQNLISLQDQLQQYPYRLLDEKVPYHKIFKEPIYGTENYFYTFDNKVPIPVFNKAQRPPKQILAVQTEKGLHYLLLSEREAADVKDILNKLYKNEEPGLPGVWLLDSNFSLICDGPGCDPSPKLSKGEQSIAAAMIEINVFGGFADNLDKHSSDFENWFLNGDSDLKLRFLKLKTARNKKQNQILRCMQSIVGAEEAYNELPSHHVFKKRAEKERQRQGDFIPKDLEEVKCIPWKKIERLNVEWIDKLGIDWNLRTACKATQIAIEKFKILNEEQAKEHNEKVYAKLKPFQISRVPGDNIDLLPKNAIRHLNQPEQLTHLSEKHIPHLHEKQAHLVPHIDKKLYQYFSNKRLIEAIPSKDIKEASPKYIDYFTKAQVEQMPADWVNQIRLPFQFGWIRGDLLEKIPGEFRNVVRPEQIQSITDISLIPRLETLRSKEHKEGSWTSWIIPEMVPNINFETQLQYLKTREQIAQVPKKYTHLFTPAQIPLIAEKHAPFLSPKQIPLCPKELVYLIDSKNVSYVPDENIPYLRGIKQIQAIKDSKRFAFLKAKTDLEFNFANQMQWIGDHQIDFVTKDQVCGLSNEHIQKLALAKRESWIELRKNLKGFQIESLNSPTQIELLSADQIRDHLTHKQVPLLKKSWTIQACPNKLVKQLDVVRQLPHISEAQIPYLEGYKQIETVRTENKFKHLVARQMVWIEEEQLKMVHAGQIPGLSTDQIVMLSKTRNHDWNELRKHLVKDQIQRFDNPKHMELLTDNQIREHLGEHQVPLLRNQRTVRACPKILVKELDPKTQVPLVAEKQVADLEGKDQIEAMPRSVSYVAQLQEKHLPHLLGAQYSWNNPHPIVSAFGQHVVNKVKDIQYLPRIDHKLWKFLPADKELIQKIAYKDVLYLSREQLRKRSFRQFLVYTIGVITLGIAGSIVAILAHMSLIPAFIYIRNRNLGRRVYRNLHAYPRRLCRYFVQYVAG